MLQQGWDQQQGSHVLAQVDHKNQLRLLYRKLGREAEAQQIEAELLKRLAYADADHPILRELKRQQESAAAATRHLASSPAAH